MTRRFCLFAAMAAAALCAFGGEMNTTCKAYSYVEQKSGAWFNSGVNLTTDSSKVELAFQDALLGTGSSDKKLLGNGDKFCIATYNSKWRFGVQGGWLNPATPAKDGSRVDVTVTGTKWTVQVNGVATEMDHTKNLAQNVGPLYIFGNSAGAGAPAGFRFYFLKHYQKVGGVETLVNWVVPVVRREEVDDAGEKSVVETIGVADLITGTFTAVGNASAQVEFSAETISDTLEVHGDLGDYGTVTPGYGRVRTGLVAGETVLCSAPATATIEEGRILADCIGYVVKTNNAVYLEGTGNSFTYTHPDALVVPQLTWKWRYRYHVKPAAGEGGTASAESDWVSHGDDAVVTATPDADHVFYCWRNGRKQLFANPLTLKAVDEPFDFRAEFRPKATAAAEKLDFSQFAHKAFVTFRGYEYKEIVNGKTTTYECATALTNFPALVKLTDGVGDFSHADCALANGGDVRFTLGDGEELPSECASWNQDGTSAFWVRVPVLSTNGQTRILAFWGNARAKARDPKALVWDKSYHAVHSHEEAGNAILDKTAYGNHGAMSGGTLTNGVVGSASSCNATKGWFGDMGDAGIKSAPLTIEMWVKRDDATGGDVFLMGRGGSSGSGTGGWMVRYLSTGVASMRMNRNAGSDNASAGGLTFGEWHHVMYRYTDDKTSYLVVDGSNACSVASQNLSASFTSLPLVGAHYVSTGYWPGSNYTGFMDEFRYSNVARSKDYARAVYLNVAHNDFFQVVEAAPEETTELSVAGEPAVEEGEGVRYVADGAAKTFADGLEVESVPAGAKHVVTVTPMRKQYRVTLTSEGDVAATLSVSSADADGWVDAGATVITSAAAGTDGREFYCWAGDVPLTREFQSGLLLTVDGPKTLTARFGSVHHVTPASTLEAEVKAIAEAGDYPSIVYVADGVYKATNTVSKSFAVTITNAIAVKAVHPHKAQFNVGGVETRGWFKLTHKDAYLEGLVVSNYSGTSTGGDNLFGYCINSSGGKIENCIIDKNYTCGRSRGAVELNGGWMRNSIFRNLSYASSGSGDGGGVCRGLSVAGGALVENCVISNCVGRKGQGLCGNGAAVVRNTLVCGCKANSDSGGGVYSGARGLVLENCTVAGCYTGGNGGGLFAAADCPLMTVNCLVGDNTAKTVAGGYNLSGGVGQVRLYCSEALTGNGNVVATPSFDDTVGLPYYPAANSLSREKGLYRAWAVEPDAFDLAGSNRVMGASVDIGAWEFPPPEHEPLTCSVTAAKESSEAMPRDTLGVQFSVALQGDTEGLVYDWDFGDGVKSSEAAPHHVYTKPGSFNVTLTVTNGAGEKAVFTEEGMVKVYATTCYVSNTGSDTEPYGSPETATPSLTKVLLVSPKKVIVAPGEYDLSSFFTPGAIDVVGDSPTNTFITMSNNYNSRIELYGTTLRNLTIRNWTDTSSPAQTGLSLLSDGTVVSNCVIRGFSFGTSGVTAIRCKGSNAKMIDCSIVGVTGNSSSGQALVADGDASGFVVERCVISNCTGKISSLISVVGSTVAPVFRNTLIAQNTLTDAGSVCFRTAGDCVVENCTIVTNTVALGGSCAGISASGDGVRVANTLLWGNARQQSWQEGDDAETVVNWVTDSSIAVADGSSATVSHCRADVLPAAGGLVAVERCTTADPKLNLGRKPELPYWGLLGDSPCRNAGRRAEWMAGATDLGGNPRAVGRPDVGCYECVMPSGGCVLVR